MTCLYFPQAANLEPNSEIIGHLVTASGGNFTYKLKMLKLFDSYGLKPTGKTIEMIEKIIAATKAKIIEAVSINFFSKVVFQNIFIIF